MNAWTFCSFCGIWDIWGSEVRKILGLEVSSFGFCTIVMCSFLSPFLTRLFTHPLYKYGLEFAISIFFFRSHLIGYHIFQFSKVMRMTLNFFKSQNSLKSWTNYFLVTSKIYMSKIQWCILTSPFYRPFTCKPVSIPCRNVTTTHSISQFQKLEDSVDFSFYHM